MSIKEELQKQEFYKVTEQELINAKNSLNISFGIEVNEKNLVIHISNLKNFNQESENSLRFVNNYKEYLPMEKSLCSQIIEWANNLDISKLGITEEQKQKFIQETKTYSDNVDKKTTEINDAIVEYNKLRINTEESLKETIEENTEEDFSNAIDEILSEDNFGLFSDERYNQKEYETVEKKSFATLISQTHGELKKWYSYLKYLQYSKDRGFSINKNTMTNFKIIFRNNATGLTTDKEPIVQLSFYTSTKKEPVFGIGNRTYQAYSEGVTLIAGTITALALENVALPHLHAISQQDHFSVTDLPVIDMFIIPIERINETGAFETLMIKGISFTETKQNDISTNTAIYNTVNFFAQSIEPLDYASTEKYFKIKTTDTNKVEQYI